MNLELAVTSYSNLKECFFIFNDDFIESVKKGTLELTKKIGNHKVKDTLTIEDFIDEYSIMNKTVLDMSTTKIIELMFTAANCHSLMNSWNKTLEEQSNSIVNIIDVSSEELNLWRFLKYAKISDQSRDYVVRTNVNSNEYEYLTGTRDDLIKNYIGFLHETNLYDMLEKEYKTLIETGIDFINAKICVTTESKINKQIVLTKNCVGFDKYLKLTLNEVETNRSVMLKQQMEVISFDKNIPTWKHFDLNKLSDDPHPTWTDFLQKFKTPRHAELWMEWIWGIFETKNKGSQILVLRGAASDGKSVVSDIITEVLGSNGAGALTDGDLEGAHWASNIWNKRLILWGDTKMNHPLSKGQIHSLATQEKIQVNIKNRNMFSVNFRGKLWLNTNNHISIKNQDNEKRRILHLELKRPTEEKLKEFCQTDDNDELLKDPFGSYIFVGDTQWPKHLKNEVYSFLNSCKKVYEKNSKGASVDIPVDILSDMLETLVEAEDKKYAVKELHFSPTSYIRIGELKEWFNNNQLSLKSDFYNIKSLYTYLTEDMNCIKKRMRIDGDQVSVMQGVSLNSIPDFKSRKQGVREWK